MKNPDGAVPQWTPTLQRLDSTLRHDMLKELSHKSKFTTAVEFFLFFFLSLSVVAAFFKALSFFLFWIYTPIFVVMLISNKFMVYVHR